MDNLEEAARLAFETTRNGMGFGDPSWDELAEETQQVYRDFVLKRELDSASEG